VTLPLRLEDFGLPGRRHEEWRWTDLSAIDAALGARANDTAPDHRRWLIDGVSGPVLLFVDGRYVADGSDPQHVHIETCGGDESHPLSRLTRGAVGATLRLAAEHATRGPIQIIHIATGGPAQLHHRLLLGEDAQASVVETYVGAPASWTNVAVDIDLAHSARLMRTVRRLGAGRRAYRNLACRRRPRRQLQKHDGAGACRQRPDREPRPAARLRRVRQRRRVAAGARAADL
jgi:Fe-S cluster assembly protein SufD